MTDSNRTLADARAAFERRAWWDAFRRLNEADAVAPLAPDDLDRLATAAYLIGDDAASVEAGARAHAAYLERGETIRAARSAFWLGFTMFGRPTHRAQAGGWLARAQRLIDEAGEPCVEQGWLVCAAARQRVAEGDFASARHAFAEAATVGERFGDRDLKALARHGEGRALIGMNEAARGMALLDEVMISVTSGEVGPVVAGIVYCSVISACVDIFDVRRAQEWTAALDRWCSSQPELVAFRGHCLVRRSELMRLHGAWRDALVEAQRACERASEPSQHSEVGSAYYQLAELHRLRGEFLEAEEAYRYASQAGKKPQPGLALLRLAQGQPEAAAASINLSLQEASDQRSRILLLSAAVEIMLETNAIAAARTYCDDLEAMAAKLDCAFVRAVAAQARGSVGVVEGDPLAALQSLRIASSIWQELDAPYELAQSRVMIGLVHRRMGDHDGAQLELDSAYEQFEKLGAVPAAARVAALTADSPPAKSTGLTGREIEVLRLIATGATNRAIGSQLAISEKTVARHVSNIFTKLDLPSRAAATAYAYEHKLL